MRVAIGADHGGFELKKSLVGFVREAGHEVLDLGADRYDPLDDYPDRAAPVARSVANGETERGVVVCGSGVGAAVAANKVRGARASVCHDTYSARQGVEHDDLNVLCLGARVIGPELAQVVVREFLDARMNPDPKYRRRLDKVIALEDEPERSVG